MTAESSPGLRKELLDEFYAECDELLAHIREGLLLIEQAASESRSDPVAVEALFRHMHSLKGNCAIVGLRVGEELAHAAEELLRSLDARAAPPPVMAIDLLHAAAQRLDQTIGAQREGLPIPTEVADLVRSLIAASDASAAAAPTQSSAAVQTAKHVWVCRFTPSAERDARGVNINAVRARLQSLGKIEKASPTIGPGGSVSFEFTVTLDVEPTAEEVAAWMTDGVQLERTSAVDVVPLDGAAGPANRLAEAASNVGHVVRVDLARLDNLMRITGELVIHRSRLDENLNQAADLGSLREITVALGRSLRELREAVSRVRLVPVSEIFSRMPFVVRDLMQGTDKRARLVTEGYHTEIDKYLVERLKEPLLHLVRNAFTHGVEAPQERRAARKPEEATINLRANNLGQTVEILVRDDGRGVDAAEIAARAALLGLPVPEVLDAPALLSLLCHAGFSTRDAADRAAGRGVGMAVVAATLRELGGTLALETTPGQGTTFRLRVPLTLSIIEALIVTVGPSTCAVPQAFLDEIIEISRRDIRVIQGTEVVPYRDALLPIKSLRTWFGAAADHREILTVLVVRTDRGSVGLTVDRAIGQREVVVRPLHDPLVRVPGFSGATELGDGRPVLILDPQTLTQGAVRPFAALAVSPP